MKDNTRTQSTDVSGDSANPAIAYDRLPDDAYAVITEMRAKPGKEDDLRRASMSLVAAVRRNAINIGYFCQEDWQSPGHLLFYEIWPAQSAFEAHNAMPEVQAFYLKLPHLIEGDLAPVKTRVLL